MELVEEKYFEDEDGTKVLRKYRIRKDTKTGKDEFLEETTHMECSQEYINNVIKPMNAKSRAKEEEIAGEMKIQDKMREIVIEALEKEKDK